MSPRLSSVFVCASNPNPKHQGHHGAALSASRDNTESVDSYAQSRPPEIDMESTARRAGAYVEASRARFNHDNMNRPVAPWLGPRDAPTSIISPAFRRESVHVPSFGSFRPASAAGGLCRICGRGGRGHSDDGSVLS